MTTKAIAPPSPLPKARVRPTRRREDRSRWFRSVYQIGLWGDSPYVRCFCRAVLLEGLGISVIKQAMHGHWVGVAISVFLLRFFASHMTGKRIDAHDRRLTRWDLWYGIGSAAGAMLAILVTHLIYHPNDSWHPW